MTPRKQYAICSRDDSGLLMSSLEIGGSLERLRLRFQSTIRVTRDVAPVCSLEFKRAFVEILGTSYKNSAQNKKRMQPNTEVRCAAPVVTISEASPIATTVSCADLPLTDLLRFEDTV